METMNMKRFGWLLVLLLAAVPAWSAKKVTVAELREMLASMHKESKDDEAVAAALKQVQMSEELDRNAMNNLGEYVPGQLATEQLYVLEARSAMFAPPASSDIPTAAAPDAASQKTILDKAETYATKTYDQLPALTANKTIRRFQDNAEVATPAAGNPKDTTVVNPWQFVRYINVASTDVSSEHGVEKLPADKDKTPWGKNNMIAIQQPDASLSQVFQEAKGGGTINWLRWETVGGKQLAVFSFDVPKKKSHLALNICCFPNSGQSLVARVASDNLSQDETVYHNYKTVVPYRGELFIDPESGTVVRMITIAGLKSSDVVHQQDTRIDYGPMTVGDKTLIVPVKAFINTEVVPNGDSSSARTITRCTLFTSEYKDYQLAGSAK
jgi:hypothetical protein